MRRGKGRRDAGEGVCLSCFFVVGNGLLMQVLCWCRYGRVK